MEFNYYLPVNLIFGRGRVAEIGTIAASYGRKALIVTGGSSTRKSGLLDRVVMYLQKAGIETAVFDRVVPNPLTTTAEAGVEAARDCDLVIGLGGGSVIDCAKAIAFLSVNKGNINEYIFNIKSSEQALPLIAVPTTCGTGSEGNGFAVLTNPETGDKKSLRTNAIVPKASIIDSELMQTMPRHVLAAVGFDALCHCMEAYISKITQPLVQAISLSGIETAGKYLKAVYDGSNEPEAWDGLAWASTIGGMAINTAGVTLPHGMEHPASGLRNIVHGEGLAALTPVITAASISGAPDKYADVSKRLGGKDEWECADILHRLTEYLQLPASLGSLGIQSQDIPWMAENCFRVSAAGIENHPVRFTMDQISELYERAL